MKILVGEELVEPKNNPEVAIALWGTAQHLGIDVAGEGNEREIWVKSRAIDLYLLTATIAQRLAAGDLELVEKGDSCGKKAYYDKLCREIRRDYEK